jgi:carbon monoxide dehydrogenase subunit G
LNLQWSGTEQIPVPKDKVWAFVTDPQRIATCLPDVAATTFRDDGSFDATVKVALGPVRGQFKLRIALQPQSDGTHLAMTVAGGGLGSVIDLRAAAEIGDNGDATTKLDWTGSAEMRGPVAAVGGRVVDAQAHKLIAQTFANVKARVTAGS